MKHSMGDSVYSPKFSERLEQEYTENPEQSAILRIFVAVAGLFFFGSGMLLAVLLTIVLMQCQRM